MLTIKVRTYNTDFDQNTWRTFSAIQHYTEVHVDDEGNVVESMHIQDFKENWHVVPFEDNNAIFVENQNGKTVEKFNFKY